MKKKIYAYLNIFIYAVLAGISIGLGGLVFLRMKNVFPGSDVIGALLFTIGLFIICTRGYNLFTGKVCYSLDNKPKYLIDLIIIWMGNIVGTTLLSLILKLTVIYDNINSVALKMVQSKIESGYLSLFLLGIICNIFIFIAVDGFKNNKHELGKYLSLFLGVSIFIICGSEHCVADMFYFGISGMLFKKFGISILCLLVITLGNIVGGLLYPGLEKLYNILEKK